MAPILTLVNHLFLVVVLMRGFALPVCFLQTQQLQPPTPEALFSANWLFQPDCISSFQDGGQTLACLIPIHFLSTNLHGSLL